MHLNKNNLNKYRYLSTRFTINNILYLSNTMLLFRKKCVIIYNSPCSSKTDKN